MQDSATHQFSSFSPMEKLGVMLQKDPRSASERIKNLFQVSAESAVHLQQFAELYKQGYVPVIYANHQSHADGVILSIVIEQIRSLLHNSHLEGFLCPVAASMATGDQNVAVAGGTNILQSFFTVHGFITVPVIREDDRKKYGMEGSNREAIEKIMNAPRDNYGLAVFPEGSVQGGRLQADGKIYGMQRVEGGGILLRCITFWQSMGRKSVLLPIGIVNSYQVFDPDTYAIAKDAFAMLSGERPVEKVVTVNAGKPFTVEDAEAELGVALNAKSQEQMDFLMRKIAELLPAEAKGYYAGF